MARRQKNTHFKIINLMCSRITKRLKITCLSPNTVTARVRLPFQRWKRLLSKLEGCPPSTQSRMHFGSIWGLHNCLWVGSKISNSINGMFSPASTNLSQEANHTRHHPRFWYCLLWSHWQVWRVFFYFGERSPFYRWENWDPWRLNVLPEIIWPSTGRVGTRM